MNDDTRTPPHKALNPVLWLVVGLPAVVVVASLATLYIAIDAGGSDAIPDDVRRTAQIQTSELGPDERAATLKLSAVLSVRENHVDVLPASGALVDDKTLRDKPLRLLLQHPTQAAGDRELKLVPTAAGWRAEIALDPKHDWRIQLLPEGSAWRLRGRLPAGQRGVLLAPAVGEVPAPASAPESATR
jgi:hypothetical protein